MKRRTSWQPPRRVPPRELAGNTHLEHIARGARECSADPLLDQVDDLAPARPVVWLFLAWLAIVAAVALLFLATPAEPATTSATPQGQQ